MIRLLKDKPERRYHLVIGLKTTTPKADYMITLGYQFRYQLTTALQLARVLINAGNLDQINAAGGVLYSAEGIDTLTGSSIRKYEA
jgi:hypothetical protein